MKPLSAYLRIAWQFWKDITLIEKVIISTIVLIIIVLVIGGANDTKAWEAFKQQYNCKLVTVESSGRSFASDANGQPIVIHAAGKETWTCNNGVTYIRNK